MADSTREKILKAAERLFGEKGFASTTLRDVTDAAGVNLAAVNYHFGSKEALFKEMMRERIEPINRVRFEQLDAALAASKGEPLDLETIFKVIMHPLGEMLIADGGLDRSFLGLIARSMTEPSDFFQEVHRDFFSEFQQRFGQEMGRALPAGMDVQAASWRIFFAFSTLFGSLIQHRRMLQYFPHIKNPNDINGMIDQMIDFVCAGIRNGYTDSGEGLGSPDLSAALEGRRS